MLDRDPPVQSTLDQQIRHTHLENCKHPDTLPPLHLPTLSPPLHLPTSSNHPTYAFLPPPSSRSEAHVKLQREAQETTASIFATRSRKRPRTPRSPTPSVRLTHPSSHERGGLASYSPSPQAFAPPETMHSVYSSRGEDSSKRRFTHE